MPLKHHQGKILLQDSSKIKYQLGQHLSQAFRRAHGEQDSNFLSNLHKRLAEVIFQKQKNQIYEYWFHLSDHHCDFPLVNRFTFTLWHSHRCFSTFTSHDSVGIVSTTSSLTWQEKLQLRLLLPCLNSTHNSLIKTWIQFLILFDRTMISWSKRHN